MTTSSSPLQDTARVMLQHGLNPIPSRGATTPTNPKSPAVPWKTYQHQKATTEEINTWWPENTRHGLGVVTGKISGNLELIELEGRAAHHLPELTQLATDSGIKQLWSRLALGWVEQSPSGGIHFYARSTHPVAGNTVLARDENKQVLAETRGEGGYTVTAPTPGTCHPTGKPWTIITGGPTTVPTFTKAELDAIHVIFQTLHQPQPEPTHPHTPIPQLGAAPSDAGTRPGDDYENKTTWDDILTPHGWVKITTRGSTIYWRRPGKNEGISATTGNATDRDRLYVFSTSTDFTPETPYTKFAAYALLNHNGDYRAATRRLAKEGYGEAPHSPVVWDLKLATQSTAATNAGSDAGGETTPRLTVIDSNAELQPAHEPAETTLTLSEDAAALRLAELYSTRATFIPDREKWAIWNDHKWEITPTDAPVRAWTREYARTLPEENKSETTFKKRLLSAAGTSAVVRHLTSDPRMLTRQHHFDTHPYQLNTPGGIVDLKTGRITAPDPTMKHTKATYCQPDPNHPTPLWDKFLQQTTNGDTEQERYLQDLAGLAAIGKVLHHVLPFVHGPGGNGKSVFMDTLVRVLADYAASAPIGLLVDRGQNHPTEIARLAGLRLVVCSEVNPTDRFDESKTKSLTGGDTLTARFMHADFFDFRPSHTIFIVGNHQPRVQVGGPSFWRRLRLVGFTHTVPPEEQIPDLTGRLVTEEAPGILAWIIKGATRVINQGKLHTPETVIAASAEYEKEEDQIKRFIDENINIGGGKDIKEESADVLERYQQWCKRQGEKPVSGQAFGRELSARFGIERTRSHGRRYYINMTLLDDGTGENDDPWSDLGGVK